MAGNVRISDAGPTNRVSVVTGSNQGLRFALAEVLGQRLGPDDTVYLSARSNARSIAAAEALSDMRAKIEVAQLDVTNGVSISRFAAMVKARHGGVDLVVSNAAGRISKSVSQAEQVRC
ncbi:MAG: SDR family NAD(P)-dependent oxidoreductase [Pseudomonadota bacterium]